MTWSIFRKGLDKTNHPLDILHYMYTQWNDQLPCLSFSFFLIALLDFKF